MTDPTFDPDAAIREMLREMAIEEDRLFLYGDGSGRPVVLFIQPWRKRARFALRRVRLHIRRWASSTVHGGREQVARRIAPWLDSEYR